MNKIISRIIFVLFLLLLISGSLYSQPVKRVLLEQFTGAWCGWCPDGSVVMQRIIEEYPDRVIGVKIHAGDAMDITDSEEARAVYSSGYPSGDVDRCPYIYYGDTDSSLSLDRSYWQSAVETCLAEPPKADVKLIWSYDQSSGKITASIMAEILEEMTGDFRFNIYILEDSVTGVGEMYEQNNNYSGHPFFENHPYHNEENVILDYPHMKVVREMLGGSWGDPAGTPSHVVPGGQYTKDYEYKVPSHLDPNNITLIGIFQKYTSDIWGRRIINCVEGTNRSIVGVDISNEFQTCNLINRNTTENFKIKVLNNSDNSKDYKVTVKKLSCTPTDWIIEDKVIDHNAANNSETEITVPITAGASLGVGRASVEIKHVETGKIVYNTIISAISADVQFISVNKDGYHGTASIHRMLDESKQNKYTEIDSKEFKAVYEKLNNLGVIAYTLGHEGRFDSTDAAMLLDAAHKGIDLLISGTRTFYFLNYYKPEFLEFFDIKFLGPCYQGSSNGKYVLIGYENDPITHEWEDQGLILGYTFPAAIDVKENSGKTHPILTYMSVDSLAGVRFESGFQKSVLIGVDPYAFSDEFTESLINRSIDWLELPTSVDEKGTMKAALEIADNPSFGKCQIRFTIPAGNQKSRIYISDILGNIRSILNDISNNPGDYNINFDTTVLPAGSYYIILESDGNKVCRKLSVIH